MEVIQGVSMQNFVDAKYNDTTFSSLGLIITSGGNRFQEKLLPNSKENAIDTPGGNGRYFFGATQTKLDISVSYAFDGLNEAGLKRIQSLFSSTELHKLELPEKNGYYMAKPTGNAMLKHLCFDENGERVYKGEGSVTFTAYWPYLQQEEIISSEKEATTFSLRANKAQEINNFGILEGALQIKLFDGNEIILSFDSQVLTLKNIQWQKGIAYIVIDCENKRVRCFDYNNNQLKMRGLFQIVGDYFSFTPGNHSLNVSGCEKYEIKYVCYSK